MKQQSRFARGQKNVKPSRVAPRQESTGIAMQRLPWTNPLKGSEKEIAMAEVSVKGAGLYVGFRMKF